MAYIPVDLLEVWAWGELVGALAPAAQRNTFAFEYVPSWLRNGVELSPFLMPAARRVYSFPNAPQATYHGLPPMIADSLPDSFGNAIVDAWLAREGIAKNAITALDRLAYLGSRGMGALEYRPNREPLLPPPTALDMGDLVTSARRAIEGTLVSEQESEQALQRIIDVGTSAGGARAKAVIHIHKATREVRSGHLNAEEGFEPWMIKFDGVAGNETLGPSQPFGRIEYAYSLMARAAGITMSETSLLEEHGRAHFMTRRFDRSIDNERIHLQSLCATDALDFNAIGAHDYAQYFSRIQAFGLGAEALQQAFRRMVFNVAAANHDDHTKNFAFLMQKDGTWLLAPAYDITHAYASRSIWLRQHLMSVNGKFSDIARADLLAVSDRFEIPGALRIFSDINNALKSWPEFAGEAGLDGAAIDTVAQDFQPVSR